uniref:Chromosome 8 C12orf56 homolog n=1 Tax=Cynoglossus semilaevis TaxID=244447 RepID=A0A3P8UY17_CYNSE
LKSKIFLLSEGSAEELRKFTSTHVISSLDPETLNLFRTPHPPNHPLLYSTTSPPASLLTPRDQRSKTLKSTQVPHRISSALRRLLHRDDGDTGSSGEEREAELHLYIVSQTSRFYLQLRSSWSRFVIRSTLLLDPVYRRKCRIYAHSSRRKQRPVLSWERTCQLFNQLSSELLQDQLSVEGLYLLLQELNTAAHRNLTLPTLFWRSGELCAFLVQTLEENLNSCQSLSGVYTPDHMLLRTMIVETLTVMFAETRNEAAKLSLLSSNNGTLVSRMLLALICDPQPQTQSSVIGSEFQVLMSEYQDAACSLLFELLLLGHEIHRSFFADDVLSAGWILGVLQTHSHLPSFMIYQAQQVVLALSDMQGAPLSPTQAVLLFQRCHLLLLCLQHSSLLAQHLTSRLSEEFRYLLRLSQAEEKLPPRYPITSPILCLLVKVLALMLHSPEVNLSTDCPTCPLHLEV